MKFTPIGFSPGTTCQRNAGTNGIATKKAQESDACGNRRGSTQYNE